MCQKRNCIYIPSNRSICYCNESCYDCFDVNNNYGSLTLREFHNSCDVRHKFACFSCKRVWKSYTNKYILRLMWDKSNDLSNYVPNICNPNLTSNQKKVQTQKYKCSWGYCDWGYKHNDESRHPKCAKCGQNALSVGRNFRHCKSKKEWIELEQKVKNGEIDLQKDFRNYPREGTPKYKDKLEKNQQQKFSKYNIYP